GREPSHARSPSPKRRVREIRHVPGDRSCYPLAMYVHFIGLRRRIVPDVQIDLPVPGTRWVGETVLDKPALLIVVPVDDKACADDEFGFGFCEKAARLLIQRGILRRGRGGRGRPCRGWRRILND